MGMIRLDKFLADAGIGTRSEVRKLIQKGRVQIDGVCCRKPEEKVDSDKNTVLCEGQVISKAPEFVYFILHKPAGYVTATEDTREKTVLELIHENRKGLFPVGRLDKDTEGLLLITDDGVLAHNLLSPKKHVWKTYYAKVDGILKEGAVQLTEQGLDIGDEKMTLPAKLEILTENREEKNCEIRLTVHEGRFHQVKRMVQALGGEVTYLKRLTMGTLTLPEDLPTGSYRALTEAEVKNLRNTRK